MKRWVGMITGGLLLLTGCASQAEQAVSSSSSAAAAAAEAVAAQSQIDQAIGIKNWPPTGLKEYNSEVAWAWTPEKDTTCKTYQDDGCWGVTVAAKYGCPGGVYIEIAILDASGATVDRANNITAGLPQEGVAKAALSPPGGSPTSAKARVSKLNCLG